MAADIARPIVWPRRSAGVAPDEPREAGRPGERTAEALDEARDVEDGDRVGRREDHRRDRDHEHAGDRGRPRPEARRGHAPRDPAGQRADRVGACQHSRAGLREVVLLGVVGQQRRQRHEEHRVDEDDSADEEEQTAHAVSRSSRASAAPETRAGRPGPRRSSAFAQRARRALGRHLGAVGRGSSPRAPRSARR